MSTSAPEMESLIAQFESEFDRLCSIGTTTHAPWMETESHEIECCEKCDRNLSWPTPRPEMWAAPVPCPQCDHVYFTLARNHARVSLAVDDSEDVDAAPLEPERHNATLPAAKKLFSAFLGGDYAVQERRQSVRYPMSAPVVVVPLGGDGAPIAEAYSMTLLDISSGGLGLMKTGEAVGDYLLVDFAVAGSPGTQCFAKVCWRKESHGITKLGVKFVTPQE
ncbi:PilZ domain-containing protein [Botrimarina mediterranea]|uniref:PilZ domain protein n=1 Tax=Botrimarina mediterranea TaxID=2528022 RepID=A0A518K3W2_9BACT|nr:PilZ domain-containing protein [Botrimarina mediterranea]QDV72494.1 PilZ domain protein [Botrimarina mediterranea]QDV77066.1 PilZ domain protein [Planctomycetes bacterium K2D]